MKKEAKRDFDGAAPNWDEEPRRVQLAREVVAALRREVPLHGKMEALDYGCGTGLVTLGLQPYLAKITGADSSPGMLAVLEQKISSQGIPKVRTQLINLEEQQRLEGSYDLIVSCMTLHHVQDVAALIGSLLESLKPGGWLAVADLQSEDGSFHDDPTGIQHHGFDRDYLRKLFLGHGLGCTGVTTAATVEKTGRDGERHLYPVLLAVARKLC